MKIEFSVNPPNRRVQLTNYCVAGNPCSNNAGRFPLILSVLLILIFSLPSFSQGVIPTKGKEFWMGFPYLPQFSNAIGTRRFDVFVTSDRSTTGTISIPRQNWTQSFSVTANQTTTINVPLNLAEHILSEVVEGRGVHIQTQDTVSIFAITFSKYAADASNILPKQSMGTSYLISSYPGLSNSSPGNLHSDFLIVASEDGTQVRITPKAPTLGGRPTGVPFIVRLNAGQSYQVIASQASYDFTGTRIEGTDSSGSCRPFAVFSGTGCTNVPLSCTACDILYDQAIPVPAWGKTYYAARFSFASSYTLRMLATTNGTIYTLNGGAPVTLNAGQFTELNSITSASCIQANKPMNVIQYMEGVTCTGAGDPSMVYLNAEEQKINNVTFSTVTSTVITQHNVNVIIKTAHINQLTLDGAPVAASAFTTFPACPTHSYASFSLTQGSHTLDADSGFTAYIYGTGDAESYAYSAGSFSPAEAINIDSILCTSDTIQLGITTPLFGYWWSTVTNPNDTIHIGPVLTITPPILPDLYVLHGNEYISGCEKEFIFNVEVPDPPQVWVSQSDDTVCQYQPVQLQAGTIPVSSIYRYRWTPAAGLNNPNISNPVATPSESTWYVVAVSTPTGCGGIVYDSLYIHVTNGNITRFDVTASDTSICTGETAQLNMIIEKVILGEDFNAAFSPLWNNITGGTASSACGSLSGNALYFNATGSREAVTSNLNVLSGGTIQFGIKIASGSPPCDDAEFGENVVLEYSTNGGTFWNNIATYYENSYPAFTLINVPIPPAAQTATTRFRWRQVTHSGINQDNWALDNILVSGVNSSGLTFIWTPSTGLSATNIKNPTATPSASITYAGQAIDPTTGCVYIDSVHIDVGQNFSLTTIPDSNLCEITGVELYTIPSWGSGHTYTWIPFSTLTDSSSATPLATPLSTTTYQVTVTSPQGCVQTDSVTINVVSLSSFDAVPDNHSMCLGDSVQADIFKSNSCGSYGSVCIGTLDSTQVAYNAYTSSSSSITPYTGSYLSSKRQYLFLASELAALGMSQGSTISQLAFQVASVSGTSQYLNFTIKMGCTSLDEMTYTYVTGLTTVFNPKPVTISIGQNYYVFDNAYDWDGTSNIVVEVCYQNSVYSSNSTIYYHTTTFNSSTYTYSSAGTCNDLTGSLYYYRPNTIFKYCPTPAGNLIYSWTPVTGVSNPTIRNPILKPAVSTTYHVIATEPLTGCIFNDNVRVNVGTPFIVTVSDDTSLCSINGIPLWVIHAAGAGATIRWTPGNLVSDSTAANPIATPQETTVFYIAVTSADGCTIRDSVRVTVISLSSFDAVPDSHSMCIGDSVQADIFKSNRCGSYGSACSGTLDSTRVAYNTYTSSSSSITPYTGSYLSSKRQYLFLASELAALGMSQGSTISQLAFQVATVSGTSPYLNFTIKMGCTNLDVMTSTFATGLTTVFNPKPVTINTGQNNYVFDNTYDWDGTSNIVIEVCYQNSIYSSNSTIYYHSTTFNSSIYTYSSIGTCNDLTGYAYYYRPNTTFRYCPTPAGNLIYSWTPVAGVSDPTIRNPVLKPVVSTMYRVTATEPLTGCLFSDSVRVNVGTPFSVTVSNDTSLCSVNGIPLWVAHAAGAGATIRWTPGISVSDSTAANPIVTPQATTVFDVAVTSSDGCTIRDSVTVTVISLSSFDAVPDSHLMCAGDSVQADIFKSNSCGSYGSACNGTLDSTQVAYNTYTSSSSSITPYTGSYLSSKRQYLFRASELAALGMSQGSTISQLAFQVATVSGTSPYLNFTIKMGCTHADVLTSTFVTGLTTVFNPKPVTITTGQNYHVFDNTYDWDGTSNIIIEVCYQNSVYSSNSAIYYHTTTFNSSTYTYNSAGTCNDLTGSTYYYRPNTTFRYCPTPAGNLIYSWTPVTGVSNPTIRNPVLKPMISTTYHVIATESLTGCLFSDSVRVDVGTPFIVTVSNDTSLCSINGIPLWVAHGAGTGATIHWTPGSLVSDSTAANPIATPQATTVFPVAVTSSDGCTIRDSVTVTVISLSSFDAVPDSHSMCAGDSVQADVFKSNSCGSYGSACSGTLDNTEVAYNTYTSSSSSTTPYTGSYISSKRQYLFHASELAALGMSQGSTISQLAFRVATVSGSSSYLNFTIKMGCTTLDVMTNTFVTGLTTVFNPKPVTITTGQNYYVFDNNYDWDGSSNIIVEVCYQNSTTSSRSTIYYHGAGFTSSIYTYNSFGVCNDLTGSISSNRPNTTFRYCSTLAGNLTYSWTPVTGVSNPIIRNPFLKPDVTSTYFVTAIDATNGCIYKDSINITVGTTTLVVQGYPDTTVCSAIGLQLRAIHNGTGQIIYNWQPSGRLTNSSSATPVISVEGTQQYIITISDSAGCSIARDTVDINVVSAAQIAVSNDTAVCLGDSVLLSAAGGVSYIWQPVTELDSFITATPKASPQTATTYYVFVTDSIGCEIVDSVSVDIVYPPLVYIGNDTSFCLGGEATFNAGSGFVSYLWQDSSSNNFFTATSKGTYWVEVTNQCGAWRDTAEVVTVYASPLVDLGDDTTLCMGHPLTLDAGHTGATYLWSDFSVSQTLNPLISGIYWVSVTDSNNCSGSDSIEVTFLSAPLVNIGNDTTLCVGSSLLLDAQNPGADFDWSTTEITQTIQVTTPGTVSVSVNNGGSCTTVDSIRVGFISPPVVKLGNDTSACRGSVITLDAGNPGLDYLWSTGEFTQSIQSSATNMVWVEVSDAGGCASRDSINIVFVDYPYVDLGEDTVLCDGISITLNAANAGSVFLWSGNENTQTKTVSTPGIYWVRVTNPEQCTSSDSIIISYLPAITVDLGPDITACIDDPLILDAGNPGKSFLWSNSLITQTISPTQSGNYWVRVSESGFCPSYDTVKVDFIASPVVSLGGAIEICSGQSTILDAGNPGASFLWSTGDLTQTISVNQTDDYWVMVTNSANCVGSDLVTITVNPLPVVSLGNDTILCAGESLTLDAGNSGSGYLWSTGGVNRNISVNNSGNYFVVVTDPNTCSTRDDIQVTFKSLPQITVSNNSAICFGDSVLLTADAPDGKVYQWSPATGLASPDSASSWAFPDITTTYQATVWDSIGCSSVASVGITLSYPPSVQLGHDTSFCIGKTATFEAAGLGFNNYEWQDGSTNPRFTASQPGTYWIEVTNQCGVDRDSVEVLELYPLPVIALGPGGLICKVPEPILDAGNPGSDYLWSTGERTQKISPLVPGEYSVMVTSPFKCINNSSVVIDLVNSPQTNLGPDAVLCDGETLRLSAQFEYASYLWQDSSKGSSFTVEKPGSYWVNINNMCGEITDSILIKYSDCQCHFYVPNAFSPNKDGFNDIFKPEMVCDILTFNMKIFNRWGELTFETHNPTEGWDGTQNGIAMNPAVFVYMINYTAKVNHLSKSAAVKGSVTLLR